MKNEKKDIIVLKLDHRPFRDKRITTHCALVARAFGANKFAFSGVEDPKITQTINSINEQWGSRFKTKFVDKPINYTKKYKNKGYLIIHLTMYGLDVETEMKNIKNENKNLLIIIGGPKVPKTYYELADYNISVTNQPHSEISSLSMFLYLFNDKVLTKQNYNNARLKITPSSDYKKVISLK